MVRPVCAFTEHGAIMAATILNSSHAIERHQGEAHHVTERFFELTSAERRRDLTFLNSL
jgi:hypothetical protein